MIIPYSKTVYRGYSRNFAVDSLSPVLTAGESHDAIRAADANGIFVASSYDYRISVMPAKPLVRGNVTLSRYRVAVTRYRVSLPY